MSSAQLTNEFVLEYIQNKSGVTIINSSVIDNTLIIEVEKEIIHKLILWLKNDTTLKLSFLTLLGGIHYPEQTDKELGVIYHLHSLINNFRLRVKTFCSVKNPSIDSIVDIYVGANWLERETYDFFGINFKGHPNLTRILNDESMDYFPMRKEYTLEDTTRTDKDDRFFGR